MSETKCKKPNEGRTCPYFHNYEHIKEEYNKTCTYGEFINKNKCYMETDKKDIKEFKKVVMELKGE